MDELREIYKKSKADSDENYHVLVSVKENRLFDMLHINISEAVEDGEYEVIVRKL